MTASSGHRALWLGLAAVLALALLMRVLLLVSGAVSFHSDEAVVALMARHILHGERPVFFYGQAYMGSLDPWLVAFGFSLLGETVQTIRLVQSALYLGVVAASYGAAFVLSGRVGVAVIAGLTLAVPNVLVALYTTATLGGYNETLLLGALIVLLGFPIRRGGAGLWRWALIGLLAGLGWWTNALIAVYLLPLAVVLLVRLWRGRAEGARLLIGPAVAIVAFALGSAPWWLFALQNDFAPLRFLAGEPNAGFASAESAQPPGVRLLGLLAFGLPAAFGLRFPWSPEWFFPIFGGMVLVIYLLALVALIRRRTALLPGGRGLMLGMTALLAAVFLLSRFSNDPTGRYFLPLTLPLGVMLGVYLTPQPPLQFGDGEQTGASVLPSPEWRGVGGEVAAGERAGGEVSGEEGHGKRRQGLRFAALALILVFHAAGVVAAARGPVGLTTQFNVAEHLPADADEDVIAFLKSQGIAAGYASYWAAFRLAFLSGEAVTFSAALPPRDDLDWTPFYDRYAPYRAAADAAPPVFVTANTPALDAELARLFAGAGLTWQTEHIGPYTVFYAFDRPDAVPRPPFAFDTGG